MTSDEFVGALLDGRPIPPGTAAALDAEREAGMRAELAGVGSGMLCGVWLDGPHIREMSVVADSAGTLIRALPEIVLPAGEDEALGLRIEVARIREMAPLRLDRYLFLDWLNLTMSRSALCRGVGHRRLEFRAAETGVLWSLAFEGYARRLKCR